MADIKNVTKKWENFLDYEKRQKGDLKKTMDGNEGLPDIQWDCVAGISACDSRIMLIELMLSDLNYLDPM